MTATALPSPMHNNAAKATPRQTSWFVAACGLGIPAIALSPDSNLP
jgi:hypothetical protein